MVWYPARWIISSIRANSVGVALYDVQPVAAQTLWKSSTGTAPARFGSGWNAAWSAAESVIGGAGSGSRAGSTAAGVGAAEQVPALTVVAAVGSDGMKTV